MNVNDTPLTYGVRQAIQDSSRTTYEIGKLSGVSPQNLYRFLDETHPRALSQKSLDKLGIHLSLTLVKMGRADGIVSFHPPILDTTGKPFPEGTPLTDFLRRAFESSRLLVPEIAQAIDVSPTQFYRFLDKSRGLSQEKLDGLCCCLGLVVEGPPDAKAVAASRRLVRKGAMFRIERKAYIPPSPSDTQSSSGLGSPTNTPTRPPSLYSPPTDAIDGDGS